MNIFKISNLPIEDGLKKQLKNIQKKEEETKKTETYYLAVNINSKKITIHNTETIITQIANHFEINKLSVQMILNEKFSRFEKLLRITQNRDDLLYTRKYNSHPHIQIQVENNKKTLDILKCKGYVDLIFAFQKIVPLVPK